MVRKQDEPPLVTFRQPLSDDGNFSQDELTLKTPIDNGRGRDDLVCGLTPQPAVWCSRQREVFRGP